VTTANDELSMFYPKIVDRRMRATTTKSLSFYFQEEEEKDSNNDNYNDAGKRT
jgi:hypothetical protein